METPGFQEVMLPMLEALADGQTRPIREVTRRITDVFGLTKENREQLLPSGQQSIISNHVAWAKSHMKMAGLLENPSRGQVRISALGRQVLAEKPDRIDVRLLRRFPAYCEFVGKSQSEATDRVAEAVVEEQRTPLELIDASFKTLGQATTEELLSRLRLCPPAFFEGVVVKLLMAMGYGGVAGHGAVTGRSGDAGIAGVIRQDKLGLDVVSIQAKR
jgi:restriction system protein